MRELIRIGQAAFIFHIIRGEDYKKNNHYKKSERKAG